MSAFLAANLGLIGLGVILLVLLAAMIWRDTVLDFVKANFGLVVLLILFSMLLAVAFHVFHNASQNSGDFLAWLEQKAGEVLAAIMTLIVGVRAANQRAGESGNGKDPSAPVPAPPLSGATHP
jgi:hypothetical protein